MKSLLVLLAPVLPPHTYLAGGSALALHIDQRDSYDLDLYSPQEYNEDQIIDNIIKIAPSS